MSVLGVSPKFLGNDDGGGARPARSASSALPPDPPRTGGSGLYRVMWVRSTRVTGAPKPVLGMIRWSPVVPIALKYMT